jgi:cytochrome b6-f complex iron-sulfur subunit
VNRCRAGVRQRFTTRPREPIGSVAPIQGMTTPAPPTRRAVLCAAGGCLALAACSRPAGAAAPSPSAAASTPVPGSPSGTQTATASGALARSADARPGIPLQVSLPDGGPAFLVRTDEGLWLLDGTCTHAACAVTWRSESKVFLCPCHLSQFDAAGRVRTPPATEPLPRIPVQERNGSVYLA